MTTEVNPRLAAILHAFVRVAVGYVIGVSVLVLAGWVFKVEVLKSFLHPDRIAMNPLTALAFMACAGSLWLQRDERPQARTAAKALAAFAVVVAVLVLASLLLKWRVRVDEWLFHDQLLARSKPNRMAPNTAVNFLLVGLALLFMDFETRHGRRPAQVLTLVAACVALLALTGYAFAFVSFYGFSSYVPMALNTALSFTMLCLGVLCARVDREPVRTIASNTAGGIMARRLLPAAYGVPLVLGWLRLQGEQAKLYDANFGLSLFALANIVAFNLLIWWNARLLFRVDEGRRHAEQALEQSEERHRAVVEQTGEAIFLVDQDTRRVIDCNPAFSQLLGYAPGEARNLPLGDFDGDGAAGGNGSAGGHRHAAAAERTYRRRDGTDVDVEVGSSLITYGGRQVSCTVARDITDRKRAERLMHEQNVRLEQAALAEREAIKALREAQSHLVQSEKLASLGQMVAGVAHEINNPLAFVTNNVVVLQRDVHAVVDLLALYRQADELIAFQRPELTGQISRSVDNIDLAYTLENLDELLARSRDGLKRIQQIVLDLRNFARLDESDLNEVDLNVGIRSTVNIVQGRAKKKRVGITLDLTPIPQVACYPAKVNQVVMNLLANAIDASDEGGEVTVRSGVQGSEGVWVEVSDHGCGMDTAVREKIFDPFFTTKPQGEGTGLGLSISYGIVRDHGGRIEVESERGKGSRFTVRLPLRPSAKEQ